MSGTIFNLRGWPFCCCWIVPQCEEKHNFPYFPNKVLKASLFLHTKGMVLSLCSEKTSAIFFFFKIKEKWTHWDIPWSTCGPLWVGLQSVNSLSKDPEISFDNQPFFLFVWKLLWIHYYEKKIKSVFISEMLSNISCASVLVRTTASYVHILSVFQKWNSASPAPLLSLVQGQVRVTVLTALGLKYLYWMPTVGF